jgi:hypothetical protein
VILELGDGRELQFPDDMPDETARQLKRLILTLEERAAAAESQARTLQDEMAAMRQTFAQTEVSRQSDNGVSDGIEAMRAEMGRGFDRVVKAALADRVLVFDDFGEPRRSRAVPST